MFKNILIPVALDHQADLDKTIAIARVLQGDGGKITVVGVVEDIPSYVAEYVTVRPSTKIQQAIRDRLQMAVAGQDGIDVEVVTGKPGVAIAEMAEKTKADLIVIRSHRPGIEDYFLGSTASRVVRRSHCAVMVLR